MRILLFSAFLFYGLNTIAAHIAKPQLIQTANINPILNTAELVQTSKIAELSHRYMLLQIEKFSDAPQSSKWLALQNSIAKEIYKNYVFEVHYLHIEDGTLVFVQKTCLDAVDKFQFMEFPGLDNNKIIPLTVMRPSYADPAKKVPVALYTHGGPSSKIVPGAHHELFPTLACLGYAIVAVNFRGSSLGPEFEKLLTGHFPEYPLEDLERSLDYIKTVPYFASDKIVLTGISFGTYINALALKKLGSQLAGAALLKGQYVRDERFPHDDPSIISVYTEFLKIPTTLSVFLAHGVLDIASPVADALPYAQKAKRHFKHFRTFFASKGNHHLVGIGNENVAPYDLSGNVDENIRQLDMIIAHTERRYNSHELRDYATHLVEFFNELIKDQSTFINDRAVPYSIDNKKAQRERQFFANAVVAKARLNQGFKVSKASLGGPKKNKYLQGAPYTQSEAYLKAMLSEAYVEKDLKKNIDTFLELYGRNRKHVLDNYSRKCDHDLKIKLDNIDVLHRRQFDFVAEAIKEFTKGDIKDEARMQEQKKLLKQEYDDKILEAKKNIEEAKKECTIDANLDNPYLRRVLYDIFQNEKRYKGCVFSYHAMSAEVSIVYDYYSIFRRLLDIRSGHDIERLRILDEAFLKIFNAQDLILHMDKLQKEMPAEAYNYLPGFQDVGIAAQFSVLGSSCHWGSSSFFRYFCNSKTGKEKSMEELLIEFFDAIGLEVEGSAMAYIKKNYRTIFDRYLNDGHGCMLQFIMDAEAVNDYAYTSEVFGFPLALHYSCGAPATTRPLPLINRFVYDPLNLESLLEKESESFKHQGGADRKDFAQQKFLNCVEARLFVKPEFMDSDRLLIKSFRFTKPEAAYMRDLELHVSKDMAKWLSQHRKLDGSMFYQNPPLLRLFDFAEKGQSGQVHKRQSIPENVESTLRNLEKSLGCKPCLMMALLAGKLSAAERLLAEEGIEVINKSPSIWIKMLALSKKPHSIEWLCNKGLVLNTLSFEAVYDLMKLFVLLDMGPTAHKLVDCGLPIFINDSQGNSLLHRLISEALYSEASIIICRGGELDEPNAEDVTCRDLIEKSGSPEFIEWVRESEDFRQKQEG